MSTEIGDDVREAFSSRQLRDALGCFATGITVVTAHPEGYQPIGLTVNSFASVSLDPPLVLWSLDRNSENVTPFLQSDHFGVNILEAGQADISGRFATRGRHNMAPDEFETWKTGAPILVETLAQFDCKVFKKFEGGDHMIFLGEVVQIASGQGNPLLYAAGDYRQLAPSQGE